MVGDWLPQVSWLSLFITEYVALCPRAVRRPFWETYVLEAHKECWWVIKRETGLCSCFYPNSLSLVGKPNKAERLPMPMGKMALRRLTHFSSETLGCCWPIFLLLLSKETSFHENRKSSGPGPNRTIRPTAGRDLFLSFEQVFIKSHSIPEHLEFISAWAFHAALAALYNSVILGSSLRPCVSPVIITETWE